MTESPAYDVLTIGHSNHAAEHFVALLRGAGATAVADVRSVPYSRRCPWFSRNALAKRLAAAGIDYVSLGDALGGRPSDPALICDGVVDYDAVAQTDAFNAGLARVTEQMKGRRVCLMCAEREPLDCHRCLLVSRALARRGFSVGHILADGTIEAHGWTEERLLNLAGAQADLFTDLATRIATAYRRRSHAVGYRPDR